MSGPDIWMPLYVGDYLADTSHLSAGEHGAYLLLLMHHWRAGTLPQSEAQLRRIARMDAEQWAESRAVLAALFDTTGPAWRHKRLAAEREAACARTALARAKATARWSKRPCPDDAAAHAGAMPAPCSSPSPSSSSVPAERAMSPAPGDLKKRVFREVLTWLGAATGKEAERHRPLVGRWVKRHGEMRVLDVFLAAQREQPVDPVAWIEAALKARTCGEGRGAVVPSGPDWGLRLRGYRPGGFWSAGWGSRPEEGGSDIPPEILAAWRRTQAGASL